MLDIGVLYSAVFAFNGIRASLQEMISKYHRPSIRARPKFSSKSEIPSHLPAMRKKKFDISHGCHDTSVLYDYPIR